MHNKMAERGRISNRRYSMNEERTQNILGMEMSPVTGQYSILS